LEALGHSGVRSLRFGVGVQISPHWDELGSLRGWAHRVPSRALSQGCILLAHPAMFGNSQSYFNQAPILLFQHGATQSRGLILGRCTHFTLGDPQVQAIYDSEWTRAFSTARLMQGGDVGMDELHLLHCTDTPIGNSRTILPGIELLSDLTAEADAATIARTEELQRSGLFHGHFISASCGWGPMQLHQEVEQMVWVPVCCDPDILHRFLATPPVRHSADGAMSSQSLLWAALFELVTGIHIVSDLDRPGEEAA